MNLTFFVRRIVVLLRKTHLKRTLGNLLLASSMVFADYK